MQHHARPAIHQFELFLLDVGITSRSKREWYWELPLGDAPFRDFNTTQFVAQKMHAQLVELGASHAAPIDSMAQSYQNLLKYLISSGVDRGMIGLPLALGL